MRVFQTKLFRKPLALILSLLVLAGALPISMLIANAEGENYKVAFTSIIDRTAGDDKEGDNYLDYLVASEGTLVPGTRTDGGFGGKEAFMTESASAYMVFKYDAGEGNVLKAPSVSWCGRAISGSAEVSVYFGMSEDPDGEWTRVSYIKNGDTGTVNNNYNNPSVTDIGNLVGNGVQTFYLKAVLVKGSMTSHTSLSDLTVTATKAQSSGPVDSKPSFMEIDGFEGDSLTLKKMESLSFTVTVGPLTAADRTCSVSVEDQDIASLTEQGGTYTLTGLADGSTNLHFVVNGNTELNRTVRLTVAGTKMIAQDYPFLKPLENGMPIGNTEGAQASVTDNGGYGLTGFAENDYIIHKGIDFTAIFGADGGTAVALKAAWSKEHSVPAKWDIYVDAISEDSLLATVSADPWGDTDTDSSVQYAIGQFDRTLTGKHDIYIVARTAGCNLYNAVYYNFPADGYVGSYDQTFGTTGNPDYSWLSRVVSYRGLVSSVAGPLRSNNGAVNKPAEVVWRIDAAAGKELDTLALAASARNIKGTGQNLADIKFSVSSDRITWHDVYVFDKEANSNGIDNGNKPESLNIQVNADNYVKGQETIYVRYSLVGYCGGVSWHDTVRVKAEVTDKASSQTPEDVPVSDVVLNSTPAVIWNGTTGSLSLEAGDEVALTTTVLPVNATDKSVTVTSSNEDILYVQDEGEGAFTLFADGEGSAVLTVTAGDVTKKVNVKIREKTVTVRLEIDPSLNENAEIVDDGTKFNGEHDVQWTGEFGLGYTTPGDYVKFSNVDLSEFGAKGPKYAQLIGSNYSGETTDKVWSLYYDEIKEENKFATFSIKPLNGWDYKQTVTAACTQAVTGTHDIYLVCEVGGSVWTLIFTNDEELSAVSYDLPFTTAFAKEDSKWLNYVVNMSGLNFDGSLTAASTGDNYSKENPVTDETMLKPNGSVTFKFTAPTGSTLKNVVLQYDGRSIVSPSNDPNCLLPGKVEFYISTDNEEYTLFETMKDYGGGQKSLSLAEYTDGLDTFYVRIDITRTSNLASWTRLTSLAVTSEFGDIDLDIPAVTPEPAGLTVPFETDFDTDDWKAGVYARTEGLDVQEAVDANGFDVSCLYPTTNKNYEGIIFKFIPESGKELKNLVLKIKGRAVGASLLDVAVSTDLENWKSAIRLSDTTVTDEGYDALKLYVETFDKAADVLYIRLIFNSTGSSEGFINYSEISHLSVSYNDMDSSVSNVPFNTNFSTGRSQLNSWLRRVVDMQGLFIYTGSTDITMSPAANRSGSITLRFNSGAEAFKALHAVINGKATDGSTILVAASKDGKNFSELAFISEDVNEHAASASYDHQIDLSELAEGNSSVWLRLELTATANAGNCFVNYLNVAAEQDDPGDNPGSNPDDSSSNVSGNDSNPDDNSPVTGDASSAGVLLIAALSGAVAFTVRKKCR